MVIIAVSEGMAIPPSVRCRDGLATEPRHHEEQVVSAPEGPGENFRNLMGEI
jgi:hypothetical protein